jgi:hypothetical protein
METMFDSLHPYLHLLQTEEGQRSLLVVGGFALGVAMREVSPADLANAIDIAAENSGIPAFAFAKHAESVIAAFHAHQTNRKTGLQ